MYIPNNIDHQNIIRKTLCAEDVIYKKIICLLSLGIQFKKFIDTGPTNRITQLKVLFIELDTLEDMREDIYQATEGSVFYPFILEYKKHVVQTELLSHTPLRGGGKKAIMATSLALLMCVNPNIASVVTDKKAITNQLKQLYPTNYKNATHRRLATISEYLPSRVSYSATTLLNSHYGPKSSRELNMFLTPNHNGICVWNSQSYLASPATIQTMLVKFDDYYKNIKRRYSQTLRHGFTKGPDSDMGVVLEYKKITLSVLQENILSIMEAAKTSLGLFAAGSVIVIGMRFSDFTEGHAFNIIVDTENPTEGCVVDTNYVATGSGDGFFCTERFVEGVLGVHKSPTLELAVENYLNLVYKLRNPPLEIEDPATTTFSITTMDEINEGFTASREGSEYLIRKFHGVNSEGYMTRPQLNEYITARMQGILNKRQSKSMNKRALKNHGQTLRVSSHNSRRSTGSHGKGSHGKGSHGKGSHGKGSHGKGSHGKHK